jgi:hypothetical protein
MKLFEKNNVPDLAEIPILDGEEWDLSYAIDQYQKIPSPNKSNKVKPPTETDVN